MAGYGNSFSGIELASIRKRRLSRPRSATDEQRLAAANLLSAKVCHRLRQSAPSNQIIDRVVAAGEFPYRNCRGRTHGGESRPQSGFRPTAHPLGLSSSAFAELAVTEAGAQFAGVEGNGGSWHSLPSRSQDQDASGLPMISLTSSSSSSASGRLRSGRINSRSSWQEPHSV